MQSWFCKCAWSIPSTKWTFARSPRWNTHRAQTGSCRIQKQTPRKYLSLEASKQSRPCAQGMVALSLGICAHRHRGILWEQELSTSSPLSSCHHSWGSDQQVRCATGWIAKMQQRRLTISGKNRPSALCGSARWSLSMNFQCTVRQLQVQQDDSSNSWW